MTLNVLKMIVRLKEFIREDSWQTLAAVLRDACSRVALQDSVEVKKLGKKDLMDFTDNLERVLLHAYNATKPAAHTTAHQADLTE